jgi:hypothetical protein
MKPGGGKAKGNRFENFIGRKLSLWLTTGKDSTQLISSRLSGGWKDARWRQAGDLAPNGPAGEEFRRVFVGECKHHKKDLLWALFTERAPGRNIQGWWMDLWALAHSLDLAPMLVCRQNNRPILVGLDVSVAVVLAEHTGTAWLAYEGSWRCKQLTCGLILFDALVGCPPAFVFETVKEVGDV